MEDETKELTWETPHPAVWCLSYFPEGRPGERWGVVAVHPSHPWYRLDVGALPEEAQDAAAPLSIAYCRALATIGYWAIFLIGENMANAEASHRRLAEVAIKALDSVGSQGAA